MGRRGPQAWEPTSTQLESLRLWSASGSTQEHCATMLDISVDTLTRNLIAKAAFEKGKAEAIAKVGGGVLKRALGGSTADSIFYLKTQGGWSETSKLDVAGSITVNIVKPPVLLP